MRGAELRNDPKAVPITVRQLEAIVRLSEALAKMSLSPVAGEEHVAEAIYLFRVSTLDAAHSGVTAAENISAELLSEVNVVETLLKRKCAIPSLLCFLFSLSPNNRLAIGSTIAVSAIVSDFVRQRFSDFVIRKTISIMVSRDELEFRNQRKHIRRKR
jgi:DNA replication licensing factor MCM5